MSNQGDQKIREKFAKFLEKFAKILEKVAKILEKSSQNSHQTKKSQNIYIQAQFKSPNLHQTTFKPLKYIQ
jgi:hypothetical protein